MPHIATTTPQPLPPHTVPPAFFRGSMTFCKSPHLCATRACQLSKAPPSPRPAARHTDSLPTIIHLIYRSTVAMSIPLLATSAQACAGRLEPARVDTISPGRTMINRAVNVAVPSVGSVPHDALSPYNTRIVCHTTKLATRCNAWVST